MPPILIFLPESLQLYALLTVTLTNLQGCWLRWRPTTRPQSSVQHVFPGYGGWSVRLTVVYTRRFLHLRRGLVHAPPLPNLSPSTLRSSPYFHKHVRVQTVVTRPSPIHGPYTLHIASTQVAGSGGYVQRHHYAFKMAESRILSS